VIEQGGEEKEDRGRGNGGGKGEEERRGGEDLGGSTSEHYDFDKFGIHSLPPPPTL
jgi:hypothetical protein